MFSPVNIYLIHFESLIFSLTTPMNIRPENVKLSLCVSVVSTVGKNSDSPVRRLNFGIPGPYLKFFEQGGGVGGGKC